MKARFLPCSLLWLLTLQVSWGELNAGQNITLTNTTLVSTSDQNYTALILKNIFPGSSNRSFKIIRVTTQFNTNFPNDEVVMIGFNMTAAGLRENTNDTAMWLQMEHGYHPTASQGYDEYFVVHGNMDGSYTRVDTIGFSRTNTSEYRKDYRLNSVHYSTPANKRYLFTAPASSTYTFSGMGFTNGMQFYGSGNLVQIVKYGPAASELRFTGWSAVRADKFYGDGSGLSGVNTETIKPSPPTTATSPGTPGMIRYDSAYVYVCIATNTWRRSVLYLW